MTLAELVEAARALPPMTPEEQEEQELSFAYGNLACTTHHRPQRKAFEKLALADGWTQERFDAWAGGRDWWT